IGIDCFILGSCYVSLVLDCGCLALTPHGGASVIVWSVSCLRVGTCLPRFSFYFCPISFAPYGAVFGF
ncbi:hypothetical protein A2U01_0071869, partial [Trifolium medium]|nr:hypothetical protein [Trifolium medium]